MTIIRLISTIFEIVVLFFILAAVFHNFVMRFDEGGDFSLLAWAYFGMLFLVASILYTALSLLISSSHKSIFVYLGIVALIIFPIVFSAFVFTILRNEAVVNATAIALASLPSIPIILIIFRYLFFRAIGFKKIKEVSDDEV